MKTEEQKMTEVINVACTPAVENYYLETNSTTTIDHEKWVEIKWQEEENSKN